MFWYLSLRGGAKRPLLKMYYAIFCFGALLFAGCSGRDAQVDAARALLDAGKFDQAFEAYQMLYQQARRRDAGTLGGLGLILTMRPASLFAGADLIRESLKKRDDPELREELVLAYLAVDRFGPAKALIDPEVLSIEELYSPAVIRLRLGLGCLENPNRYRLKNLSELPEHPRRDFYFALCAARAAAAAPPATKDEARDAAFAALEKVSDPALRCDLAAFWPREVFPGDDSDFGERELERCRTAFPGRVAVHRVVPENLPEPGANGDRASVLFENRPFDPEDPGAEYDKPPVFWRAESLREQFFKDQVEDRE